MTDKSRSKEDLLRELNQLKKRVAKFEGETVAVGDVPVPNVAWKQLVQEAPIGVFISQDPYFVFTNPMVTEITGYSSKELKKMSPWDVVHPDMRERVKQRAMARMRGEAVKHRYEIHCQKRSGESIWIDYSAETIKIGGKLVILGTLVDITTRKEAQESLDESEEKYRNLLDSIPVGVFQASTKGKGKVVSANPALVRMYGCDNVEEYLALPDRDSFRDPSERDKIVSILRKKKEIYDYEVQMRKKDGSYFWITFNAHAVYDKNGKVTHFDGVEIDITERKLATDALKQSGKTMSALLNAPNQPLFLIDTQGILLTLNEAMAERLGRSVEELIGTCIHDSIPAPLVESRKEKELEVIESGKPVEYVEEHEGTWLDIRLYPVSDVQGRVEAIAIYAVDITDRKLAEEALRESERFNRAVIENSPLGISVRNRYGKLLSVNQAWRDIWEIPEETICEYMAASQDKLRLDRKDAYLGKWQSEVVKVYREGGLLHIPEIHVSDHQSGDPRWVSHTFYAIEDASGQVDRVVILTNDITEHKRAEEELKQYHGHLEELVEERTTKLRQEITERKQAETLMLTERDLALQLSETTTLEETLEYCLEAAIKVSGMDVGGIYIVNDSDGGLDMLVHSGLSEEFVALGSHYDCDTKNSELIKQGDPIYVEYEKLGIDLDDIRIWEGLKSIAILPVKYQGRVVACLNVASQTKASIPKMSQVALESLTSHIGAAIVQQKDEEALRESEASYRQLFNSLPYGAEIIDKKGIITKCSQSTARMLGYEMDEIIGKHITEFVDSDTRNTFKQNYPKLLSGESLALDVCMVHKDGTILNILRAAEPILNADGEIEAVLALNVNITERKQIEQALRESEEQYRSVVENARELIWQVDTEGKFVFFNSFAERVSGQKSAAWHGKHYAPLIHSDDLVHANEAHEKVMAGNGVEYEIRIYGKGGEIIQLEVQAIPIYVAGEVAGALNFGRDTTRRKRVEKELRQYRDHLEDLVKERTSELQEEITERKQAEEALQSSQANLSAIVENTDDFILLSDHTGSPIYFNSAYAQIMKELLGIVMKPGLKPHTLLPDEHERAKWDGYHRRVLSGESFAIEYSSSRPNGQIIYLSTSFYPIRENDKVIGFSEFTHDITIQKRTEEALRESEDKFRMITERSFDAIYISDMNGKLTYVSPAAEKMLGYRLEDIVGRNVSEFIHGSSLKDVGRSYAEVSQGHTVEGLQFDVIGSDGQTVNVEVNSTPIIQNDLVVGYQAIVRDVSERRHAEELLMNAYKDQSRQLRQVAGGLAHDIYNDLFPVAAAIRKIQQRLINLKKPVGERDRKLLRLMDSAVRRAIDMTESVNVYSKLDRNEVEVGTNLVSTIGDVADQNSDVVSDLGISLDIQVSDKIDIACPRIQLFHLFNNLFLNAIDAVQDSATRLIRISASMDNKLVRIKFEDSGHGITPETLSRMFEPFFSTRPKTGTGLGLAIVQRIVDLCVGKIEVESSLDKGTIFTIILPGNVGTQK